MTDNASSNGSQTPVFGFILFGGPISGALIRDIRLANELACRGYTVHVWWAMDKSRSLMLDQRIKQHWLFHGLRYWRSAAPIDGRLLNLRDSVGRMFTALYRDHRREHFIQKRPQVLRRTIEGLLCQVRDGVGRDRSLIRRFARQLDNAGVTHVLPMLAVLCPFVQQARPHMDRGIEYLVTFQGYELYVNYARAMGFEDAIYQRFIDTVAASGRPAIGVSEDYCQRVVDDIGLSPDAIRPIPPGVDIPKPIDRYAARQWIKTRWAKGYDPKRPLISYIGRRDTEKGIDLFLYAAAIVRQRGLDLQLVVAGPTLFGNHNIPVLYEIAENLRLPVFWAGHISDEFRTHLFAASTAVVYPSIHREPFGMVPVEAIALGTPAIVPDFGGVRNTIQADDRIAGLRFRTWDSGSLADAIAQIVTDTDRWRQLSANGPAVADYYSIRRLGDRILAHLGLPQTLAASPSISRRP